MAEDHEMHDEIVEMEQAADGAKAAVDAESGANENVKDMVNRLHDRARDAKKAMEAGHRASMLRLLEEAEEAADDARDAAEADPVLSEGVKAVVREAHDKAKEARDAFR
ncbi:MAG: hypothetical protein H0V09_04270 [Gemmatimonadetes bacterium]|nr:hypothetical protein [Gemmatimonadota bacterium]